MTNSFTSVVTSLTGRRRNLGIKKKLKKKEKKERKKKRWTEAQVHFTSFLCMHKCLRGCKWSEKKNDPKGPLI